MGIRGLNESSSTTAAVAGLNAVLGSSPQGSSATVKARLDAIDVETTELDRRSLIRALDRFAARADGALGNSESGHTWIPYGSVYTPVITGSKMGFSATPNARAAVYPQMQMSDRVVRIGGRFTFGAGTTTGAAVFIAWQSDISTTMPTLPNSPFHFVITPGGWRVDYIESNVITNVASGNFVTALAQDGTTVHTAELVLDALNSAAFLLLPDGTRRRLTSAKFGTIAAGEFACFESYVDKAGDCLAAFTEVWADSDPASINEARMLHASGRKPTVVRHAPGTQVDYTLTTTSTDLDATNLSAGFVFGESGAALVEFSVWGVVSGSTGVLFSVILNGTNVGSYWVANSAQEGYLRLRTKVTTTPHTAATIKIQAFKTAGTAVLSAAGPKPATIVIEDC